MILFWDINDVDSIRACKLILNIINNGCYLQFTTLAENYIFIFVSIIIFSLIDFCFASLRTPLFSLFRFLKANKVFSYLSGKLEKI